MEENRFYLPSLPEDHSILVEIRGRYEVRKFIVVTQSLGKF